MQHPAAKAKAPPAAKHGAYPVAPAVPAVEGAAAFDFSSPSPDDEARAAPAGAHEIWGLERQRPSPAAVRVTHLILVI
jgi:hypothetical protein